MRQVLASAAFALLGGCGLLNAEPSEEQLADAIVAYMGALPGFSQVDERTVSQVTPFGLNTLIFHLDSVTKHDCEKREDAYACDVTTSVSLRVGDGQGERDAYSDAVTGLVRGTGGGGSTERRLVTVAKSQSGWRVTSVSGQRQQR